MMDVNNLQGKVRPWPDKEAREGFVSMKVFNLSPDVISVPEYCFFCTLEVAIFRLQLFVCLSWPSKYQTLGWLQSADSIGSSRLDFGAWAEW